MTTIGSPSWKAAAIIMRGDVPARAVANAEELTLHAMSSGVSLITLQMADVLPFHALRDFCLHFGRARERQRHALSLG